MAYINHLIFSGENGRVLGYDNSHNFHHRHYFGETSEVDEGKKVTRKNIVWAEPHDLMAILKPERTRIVQYLRKKQRV